MPYLITDIKIFNRSFAVLEPEVRERISSVMPSFTRKLDLPYGYNNFSIEFASLTYKNPGLNRYAYQLVGFDKDWQYTDANRRFAYYNNLKSGTYRFRLKATNEMAFGVRKSVNLRWWYCHRSGLHGGLISFMH